jgi:hypothetical protein
VLSLAGLLSLEQATGAQNNTIVADAIAAFAR